jgi:hypothetical protein
MSRECTVTGNRLLGVPAIRLLTPGNQVRWRLLDTRQSSPCPLMLLKEQSNQSVQQVRE